jgi:uncharacterized membrane protein YphA (DoxX/SURF4 family)
LALDLVRIFLGVALCIRGVLFLIEPETLLELTQQPVPGVLGYYVVGAHIIGGLLMAIGLFTRAAALIQIPVLIGAVFTLHIREGLFTQAQSLELATLVLFLLVIFFVFGAGKHSLGYRMTGRKYDTSAPTLAGA